MMRYLILLVMLLLCLPVRGEAWQVVGGGEAPISYTINETFTSGSCSYFNDVAGVTCSSSGGSTEVLFATGYGYLRRSLTLTSGLTYNFRVGLESKNITNGTVRIGANTLVLLASTTSPSSTPTTVTGTFVADATNFRILMESGTSNQSITISSIQVWPQ